jgi:hypothetical protein
MQQIFTDEQIAMLNKKLDPRLVSERSGGGNTKLEYLKGHTAIDQADRIFGYGKWGYRTLSCEQSVIIDPLTGEAVGVAYKAQVELTVDGCVPIVEVGSQPVATWNVEDYIMSRRINDARYSKTKKTVDDGPFTLLEKMNARTAITNAHEQAEKGAVTDAVKRALRTFGDQFGNGLYGDGRIIIDDNQQTHSEPAPQPTPPTPAPAPRQLVPPVKPPVSSPAQPTSTLSTPSFNAMRERCKKIKIDFDAFMITILKAAYDEDTITPEDHSKFNNELIKREQNYAANEARKNNRRSA